MNLEALHDYVIVQPHGGESTTESGIVIATGNNAKREAMRGTVLATGPGKWSDSASDMIPMAVQVGDTVLFDNNRSQAFSHENEVLHMMRQDCIFARAS